MALFPSVEDLAADWEDCEAETAHRQRHTISSRSFFSGTAIGICVAIPGRRVSGINWKLRGIERGWQSHVQVEVPLSSRRCTAFAVHSVNPKTRRVHVPLVARRSTKFPGTPHRGLGILGQWLVIKIEMELPITLQYRRELPIWLGRTCLLTIPRGHSRVETEPSRNYGSCWALRPYFY